MVNSSFFTGGTVTLKTNNTFDAPLINPAYLTAPVDLAILMEGTRAFFRFMDAPAWSDVSLGPNPGFITNASDSIALENFARNTVIANLHPVGTASMSPVGASWGVVNPDLRLKQASGLRIIDASVFVRLFQFK